MSALACCNWSMPTKQAFIVARDGFRSLFESQGTIFERKLWRAARRRFSRAIRQKLMRQGRLQPDDALDILEKTVRSLTMCGGNLHRDGSH